MENVCCFRGIVTIVWLLIILLFMFAMTSSSDFDPDGGPLFRAGLYTFFVGWFLDCIPWWIVSGNCLYGDLSDSGFFRCLYYDFFGGGGVWGFLLGIIPCFYCLVFVLVISILLVMIVLDKSGLLEMLTGKKLDELL